MTAEEELRQYYKDCEPREVMMSEGFMWVDTSHEGVYLAPKQIDLIANLVVERLNATN